MLHHRKFVKDVGVLGAVLAITRFKGIILLTLLTKSLGAEGYGIWAQILVTLSLITPLALLGLPHALVRFLPGAKEPKETREYVWSSAAVMLAASLVLSLPFLLFPEIFGGLIKAPSSLILLLAVLIVLETMVTTSQGVFRAFGEIGKYSFFSFLVAGGEIAFTALALALGTGLLGAILALVAVRLLVLLLALLLLLWKIGFSFPAFSHTKEHLNFGIPTLLTTSSHWVVQVSDRYLIAGFLGVLFVGYYAPAYTIALVMNLFILPVPLILQPVLSKFFAENDMAQVKKYLSYSLKYVLFITLPAAFGIIVLSKQLLIIFTTNDIALHAAPIIPLVVGSILLYGVYTIFSQVLLLFKKTRTDGMIWLGAAASSILLNLLLIPLFGILGAAIATLAAYTLALAGVAYFATRYLTFPVDWKFVSKSFTASLLMFAVLLVFGAEGLYETIAAVLLGAAVYGTLILAMRTLSTKEIQFFRSMLKIPIKTMEE